MNDKPKRQMRKYTLSHSQQQEAYFLPHKELAVTEVMKYTKLTRDKLLIHRSDANALYGRILIYHILSHFGCPIRVIGKLLERKGNYSYICIERAKLEERWKKPAFQSEKEQIAAMITTIEEKLQNQQDGREQQ
jgi:hypothetical protein